MSFELGTVSHFCRAAFAEPCVIAPPAALDWELFLRLAKFHRVQGLVRSGISKSGLAVPHHVAERLAGDATAIAAANLRAAEECARLLQEFEQRSVPLLFVKGLTLAELAYGSIATKASVDIDVLTGPRSLREAVAVLRHRGYRLVEPANDANLFQWHHLRKESAWAREDQGLRIDLHTRLADNPQLIPRIGLESSRQTVQIAPTIALPTIARDELFAYLAVHGSSSAWFRLKWITDLAALIHGATGDEIARLYERSQELGAGRAPAQALLLADSIYGSLAGAPALKSRLEADRVNQWLHRIALRQLTGMHEPIEPTARPLGTAAIHYSQLLLMPGIRFKFAELARQARAALA